MSKINKNIKQKMKLAQGNRKGLKTKKAYEMPVISNTQLISRDKRKSIIHMAFGQNLIRTHLDRSKNQD
jgi:hypothetical protein